MILDRQLHLLLLALQQHLIDPHRLADAVAGWTPAGSRHGFMAYLVEQGALTREALQHLEAQPIAPDQEEAHVLPILSTTSAPPSLTPGGGPNANLSESETIPFDSIDGRRASAGGETPQLCHERYTLLRLHETGGLGQVWLARDTVVGRDVALKTLRPDRAGTENALTRFVREAQVTGKLEHPSIVPLYDLEIDGKVPFYVMRFVSGRTLAQAVTEYHRRRESEQVGPLELITLLDAFIGVCRAVAFAHSREILHRDLKGQNVVVGAFGEVFLLDWGLAKEIGVPAPPLLPEPQRSGKGDTEASPTGRAVGTPAYMAPEVARGGASTKQADIYGLGAILYALLTGKPPYSGSSVAEILQQVTTSDPAPIWSINPSAPPPLEAISRKAMAPNPADRYTSADDVATEVRRWLADEPVDAYGEPRGVRLSRWARKHQVAVVALAILLLTAILVASLSSLLSP